MEDLKLKVLFYLKRNETNKEGLCPVMGRIRIGGTMAQFGTRLTAQAALWNTKAGRLAGKGGHATEVNAALNRINVSVNASCREILARKGTATAGEVKSAFQGMACSQETLLGYFGNFIAEFSKRAGIDRSQDTVNGYVSAMNNLSRFLWEKYRLSDIPFSGLTYSFIEDYDYWMLIVRKFKPNSIINNTTRLNFVVKHAVSRGHLTRNPLGGYRPPRPVTNRKYLSDDELKRIMTTPLDKEHLYLTRDMFLFSCFTGLSCVDITHLTGDNLCVAKDGVWWIKTFRKKTGVKCNVPMLEIPLAIIEKYRESARDGKLLPMPDNSTLNENLKKIAARCGIARNLTFHMARHNFATHVTLSQGVPITTVSRMMGHTSVRTTQIYAKMADYKVNEDVKALSKRIEGKYKLYDNRMPEPANM